jgi:hypothetical protein
MSDQTEDNQWHLDKKVPISLIVAVLVQAAMGIWAIADIKKDVEVLKVQAISQHERDDRQDKSTADVFLQLRTQLERMDAKLDRLVESRTKGQQ